MLCVFDDKVVSGVANQPMSDAETMEGALNRARNALRADDSAHYGSIRNIRYILGVGLEGGVQKIGNCWFESGWIAIVDRSTVFLHCFKSFIRAK